MTLKEKIDQYKRKSAGKATPEMVEVMQRSTADLQATVADRPIPKAGDLWPSFRLPDSSGNTVASDELLQSGHLVVSFFRGMW